MPLKVDFCKQCKGLHHVTKRTGNAQRFGIFPPEGEPWTKAVDESKNAQLQVIEPVECPRCHGTAHEPE